MEPKAKYVTLKHLLIENQKKIGLQFYPNKLIQTVVKGLPKPKWSKEYNMAYVENTPNNLNLIFKDFKGVAWVNCSNFFPKHVPTKQNVVASVDHYRNRKLANDYRPCPEEFLQKLELKHYALNTSKVYIGMFEHFINYFKEIELLEIDEEMIRGYLQTLVIEKKSDSYINQMINSVKFYYEVVLGMPNRFYSVERPRKRETLPKVISKEEVKLIIENTNNIKHKCIVSLLYSAGLRRGELIDLKLNDIDSKRMVINVRQGKGNKDRITLLSPSVLEDLRAYFIEWKPKMYLFEGQSGNKYSAQSVAKVVKNAAKKAKIKVDITPHILRHSFATHLLENGTNIRYIQALLGHSSTKTTEIYTHVATNNIQAIKSPLD
ncbi:MAG: tyrosine-type recombinase/integrase [Salibacteraceae bacterium]|nr:tyrosine-type recombinase/integrase [Salibacteraceae bacterium]|tara:strand:+ start:6583 stop:7713 length:1131 start_codon:yes stop_codon:yes gene_type:complete